MAKSTDEADQKQQAKSDSSRNLLLGLGAVVILAAAFLAGVQVADNHRRPMSVRGFGMPFQTNMKGFGGRYGGGVQTQNGIVLSGKVASVNGNDFTIDQNGSTKTVKTDGSTRFRGVGISGLKGGDQVTVSGTTNSDGSIQALSVSVGTTTTNTSTSSTESGVSTQSF